ncbi:hypothetical protein HWV62_26011 [Athelia sp. TMB]|nr:hypothetical protein HWV62_26011 [Athelia sp. TMB]
MSVPNRPLSELQELNFLVNLPVVLPQHESDRVEEYDAHPSMHAIEDIDPPKYEARRFYRAREAVAGMIRRSAKAIAHVAQMGYDRAMRN